MAPSATLDKSRVVVGMPLIAAPTDYRARFLLRRGDPGKALVADGRGPA